LGGGLVQNPVGVFPKLFFFKKTQTTKCFAGGGGKKYLSVEILHPKAQKKEEKKKTKTK